MYDRIKDQYDSLYESQAIVFGGGEPLPVVGRIKDYLEGGSVLDIGGGGGRNALYLAEQGFSVTVLDISAVGIANLETEAKTRSLEVNTAVGDVVTEGIEGMFDGVVMSFVFHHLDAEDVEKVIVEAKAHTRPSGVHILATFMDQGDLATRNQTSGRFYPNKAKLKALYADWAIKELSDGEITTHARGKDGSRLMNHVVTLVAVKD